MNVYFGGIMKTDFYRYIFAVVMSAGWIAFSNHLGDAELGVYALIAITIMFPITLHDERRGNRLDDWRYSILRAVIISFFWFPLITLAAIIGTFAYLIMFVINMITKRDVREVVFGVVTKILSLPIWIPGWLIAGVFNTVGLTIEDFDRKRTERRLVKRLRDDD